MRFHTLEVLSRAIETGSVAELEQQDPTTYNTDWRIWDAEEREQEKQSRLSRAAREAAFDQLPPEVQEQMRGLRGNIIISISAEKNTA